MLWTSESMSQSVSERCTSVYFTPIKKFVHFLGFNDTDSLKIKADITSSKFKRHCHGVFPLFLIKPPSPLHSLGIQTGCCSAMSSINLPKQPFEWGSPCHLLHLNSFRYSCRKLGFVFPFILSQHSSNLSLPVRKRQAICVITLKNGVRKQSDSPETIWLLFTAFSETDALLLTS